LSTNEYIKDYIDIITSYKDTSIFTKTENNVDYQTKDMYLLTEYYLNGNFLNKNELTESLKDFLSKCLHVNPNKRLDSSSLINHKLFNDIKIKFNNNKLISKKIYYLSPIDREILLNHLGTNDISKKFIANSFDNYEIIKTILKKDLISLLKKKGIIDYKPKIMKVPSYFSFFFKTKKFNFKTEQEKENIHQVNYLKYFKNISKDNDENNFSEGNVVMLGNFVIDLPIDYEKDRSLLDKFFKSSVYDIDLFRNSDQLTNLSSAYSDNNSDSEGSKCSKDVKDNVSIKSGNQNKILLNNQNSSNNISNPMMNIDKEINHYFNIKFLLKNLINQTIKKEALISEIKKNNYSFPECFRPFIYKVLLDVDFIVEKDDIELTSLFENKNTISKDMTQIKKDVIRCEEYDELFKIDEGRLILNSLFETLLYNNEDFFYVQGMDSIAAAIIKLYYPDTTFSYHIFQKFVKKILYNFFDIPNKTILSLRFHHLIISRLLAFLDPELQSYLEEIQFFDDQFATNWLITIFSSKNNIYLLFTYLLIYLLILITSYTFTLLYHNLLI